MTTEIYSLSLHDALPISVRLAGARGAPQVARIRAQGRRPRTRARGLPPRDPRGPDRDGRSEEHTSELQSRRDLVCRLLLEKKKTTVYTQTRELLDLLVLN